MSLLFVCASPLSDLRSRTKSTSQRRCRFLKKNPPVASATKLQPLVRVRSSVPAVLVRGGDRVSFVNGMGTNAFSASIKEPVQTVLTSNIGRCVDLVTALQYDEFVLLLSSLPEGKLYEYLDRYIFPADDVEVQKYAIPNAVDVMGTRPEDIQPPGDLQALPTTFGCTIVDREVSREGGSEELHFPSDWIATLGTVAHDDEHWEAERVQRGIPLLGTDITSDYNPLECGLWHWVSFEKGCYIGQETIARLNTYDGVKQVLCLVEFEGGVEAGDEIRGGDEDGRAAGKLTSVSTVDGRCRALGYVRRKSGLAETGSTVLVNGVKGCVLETLFLKHGYEDRSLLAL